MEFDQRAEAKGFGVGNENARMRFRVRGIIVRDDEFFGARGQVGWGLRTQSGTFRQGDLVAARTLQSSIQVKRKRSGIGLTKEGDIPWSRRNMSVTEA